MRNRKTALAGWITMVGLFGCAAQPPAELATAQQRMNQRDYAGTLTAADAAIAKSPSGPNAAQAYYLKGRALEMQTSDTPAEAKERLQEARTAYIAALKAGADKGPFEGLVRAAIANVSYWQEDYTTAAQQGLAAAPLLQNPTDAAWTLYRTGLSQQRLGQFAAADSAFDQAIARDPSSDPAARAQAHKGIRAFNIRILFDRDASAQLAAKDFAQRRLPVARRDQTAGAAVELLVGNFPTYAAALSARQQLVSQYPNAVVVP